MTLNEVISLPAVTMTVDELTTVASEAVRRVADVDDAMTMVSIDKNRKGGLTFVYSFKRIGFAETEVTIK